MKFPKEYEYEELRKFLGTFPAPWYPDLIRAMVQAAYKKNVFKPKGASTFIQGVEDADHGQAKGR